MIGHLNRAGKPLDIYAIGAKLRALRKQKGLTLSRLAKETRLSTALLSKLETENLIPTLPTLLTISSVFGVGLSFFFAEPTHHSVSITRKASSIAHKRARGTLKATPLNMSTDAQLRAKIVEFPPRVAETLTEAGTPLSGVVYVLEGSLQFAVGGVQEQLEAGDCVCVETEMVITWSAIGRSSCQALIVTPSQ